MQCLHSRQSNVPLSHAQQQGSNTVQKFLERGSRVLTWTAAGYYPGLGDPTPALIQPVARLRYPIGVEAGKGAYEGAVRFRNSEIDYCMTSERRGVTDQRMTRCDLDDPEQVRERFEVASP
jgi:hypothetical protein